MLDLTLTKTELGNNTLISTKLIIGEIFTSEEFYTNLNTPGWGPVQGFDQNRVFVGAGYNFDSTYRAEIGYMNQYVNRGLVDDLINHQLSLNLYVNIPD